MKVVWLHFHKNQPETTHCSVKTGQLLSLSSTNEKHPAKAPIASSQALQDH
jgi:hypothetical protein